MSFCLLGYDGIMCSGHIYIIHGVIMSVMLLVNVVMVILVLGDGEVDSSGHIYNVYIYTLCHRVGDDVIC